MLDLWFREDVEQMVKSSAVLAVRVARANGIVNREYLKGVLAMAQAQAIAFGIPWDALWLDAKRAIDADCGELLDSTQKDIEI